MNRSKQILAGLAFLLAFTAFTQPSFAKDPLPTNMRMRYGGSFVLSLPTGYCRPSVAYVNDNKESHGFISQNLGQILEVSVLRYWSGDYKNKNSINGKFALLSEGTLIPAVSFGAVDINTQTGDDRIYYAAASKSFEDFGLTIHVGIYKDPVDKEKVIYYGAEKVILPLLSVAAEHVNDKFTYGIKITPYPGVSLDVSQRDGKEEIFNLIYSRSY